MMRFFSLITLFLTLTFSAEAQFFQFSQRDFTPQRVNPARVGSRDFIHAMVNFRNQTTAGDFSLLSTTLDLAYPVSWGGERRGGIGLFLMDDRSGSGGIYSVQEVGLSTAFNVPTTESSSLSMGISLGYQRRSFDFTGLSTGAQFVADRGFDLSIGSGEDFQDPNASFLRWNAGVYWRKSLTNRLDKSYLGISFFDVNRANESVFDGEEQLPVSFVAEGGFGINRTHRAVIWADGFVYGSGNNLVFQGGIKVDSEIQRDNYLKILARYSTENYVIVGAGLEKDNFEVGVTYDIGIGNSSVSNQSAFEVGLQWKLFVKPKGRKKRGDTKTSTGTRTRPKREVPVDSLAKKLPIEELEIEPEEASQDTTIQTSNTKEETELSIGQPRSKKRIVDEYEVRLPFRFNSYALSEEFTAFLDEVLDRLQKNPGYTVEVIGHTDNVGSDEVNDRISLSRAQAAADYLTSRGIAKGRIQVEGKGESLPVGTNETADGRAINRRVEIKILK